MIYYLPEQPTFLQNLAALTKLKYYAMMLQLTYFSQNTTMHQLALIKELKKELTLSQERLQHHQSNYEQHLLELEQKLKKSYNYKYELYEINQKLVDANQKLAENLYNKDRELEECQQQLASTLKQHESIHYTHRKYIENLKLLHAQYLFIQKNKYKK